MTVCYAQTRTAQVKSGLLNWQAYCLVHLCIYLFSCGHDNKKGCHWLQKRLETSKTKINCWDNKNRSKLGLRLFPKLEIVSNVQNNCLKQHSKSECMFGIPQWIVLFIHLTLLLWWQEARSVCKKSTQTVPKSCLLWSHAQLGVVQENKAAVKQEQGCLYSTMCYSAKCSRWPGELCVCLGRVHGTNCYITARLWGILLEQLFDSCDLWGGLCCCQRRHNCSRQWRLVDMLVSSSLIRSTYVLSHRLTLITSLDV